MKMKIIFGVSAAALMCTAANAAVTGDPASGWFVGKGDVQSAFGWNNATLQEEWASDSISFFYNTSVEYEVTCEWTTGKKTHTEVGTISAGLNAAIFAEGRQRNQITGFTLDPVEAGTGGDVPELGDSCSAEGGNEQGSITEVTLLGGGGGGGLFVSWNGDDVLLQPAL